MFLDKLEITDKFNNNIRTIKFKKGLNLIIGLSEEQGSTNNIGKTTLLRCIDFCLGGDIKQIYQDKEFKNTNNDIFEFLKNNTPTFKLTIKDSLENPNITYTILRSIYFKKENIKVEDYIFKNNNEIEFEEFKTKLKQIFFNNSSLKPSFRQLIPKFIRKNEEQLLNVLRYLFASTSDSEYEKIHLSLFGFSADTLLDRKSKLEKTLKKTEDELKILKQKFNLQDLKQMLEIVKNNIEKLSKQRDDFEIDSKYQAEEEELKNIQLNLMKIENHITDLNLKISISTKQRDNIENGLFTQDTNTLKLLYEEVKFYTESMHKSFENVVNFHNKMIKHELEYTIKKIDNYNKDLSILEEKRGKYAEKYSNILQKLSKTGSLAEYTKLNQQLEANSEEKGRLEQQIDNIQKTEEYENKLKIIFEKIKAKIDTKMDIINNNITDFNSFFTSYSDLLYGQKFFLSYEDTPTVKKFSIKDMNGNEGHGKKQVIISAFDLAYIDFVNKINKTSPRFSAIDKVEIVDIEKLQQLFNISNNINGQFIIPIIYDKIESIYEDYKANEIIALSQSNKFFNF
ncbi:AAA family ATPase [Campylobacter pinnipediorum]|uniref:Rad50/SbcC-type AAA domain-containing protein n=1 Tax=Campylobacter pinnipediorum subsp. pinnipediorum TaxID=1660067 RepID=A0AAX0LA65_9BACT|nr:AAA family ATPase [Campylobacter pinnipediorum]AQW82889.1 ATPase, AAA family [Campylobacter pinnipediorum subsp. pinnipediorum]OPA77231.1 hypothetical protein BFG04_03810 [Campylobacter pinnipediorum subsp. pinnipediorum]